MSACPRYQETLWLDVHNELSATARAEWEAHLKTCEGCRKEKMYMGRLIMTMQGNMQPPTMAPLSSEDLFRLIEPETKSIFRINWWRQHLFGRTLRLMPALATFGIFLLVVGILSYRTLNAPSNQTASSSSVILEQTVIVDVEMLKHLDLLKDMESIQKLIQVADTVEFLQPRQNYRENTQGKMRHDCRAAFV